MRVQNVERVLKVQKAQRKSLRVAFVIAMTLAAVTLGAVPGTANAPGEITVAATGGVTPGFPANELPYAVTTGPDDNVWFTLGFTGIARRNPDGSVNVFTAGITGSSLQSIISGPDGNLWFTEFNDGIIAKSTTGGVITEVAIPGVNGFPTGNVEGMAVGADGNIWFTRPFTDTTPQGSIGKLTPSGTATIYTATYAATTEPRHIAAGADGNLWFTDSAARTISKVDPTTGTITVVATAGSTAGFSAGSIPAVITAGPDGRLWFVASGGVIGAITTAGVVTEYPVGNSSASLNSIAAACGELWAVQGGETNSTPTVWQVTTSGGLTPHTNAAVQAAGIDAIAAGPDGDLWMNGLADPGTLLKVGTSCEAQPVTPAQPVAVVPAFTG